MARLASAAIRATMAAALVAGCRYVTLHTEDPVPESRFDYHDAELLVIVSNGLGRTLGVTHKQAVELIALPHDNARDALFDQWLRESERRS